MSDIITAALTAASIPSALFGLLIWYIKRKIEQSEKEREEKDKNLAQHELLLVQGIGAAIALGEATARAVERIPDAHCNGDMHKALGYATAVKHKQKEFLQKQGVEALFD